MSKDQPVLTADILSVKEAPAVEAIEPEVDLEAVIAALLEECNCSRPGETCAYCREVTEIRLLFELLDFE